MEPRTRFILLLTLGTLFALAAGCYLIANKIYSIYYEKPPRDEKPHLYAIPEFLELEPCPPGSRMTVSVADFSIDFPWTEVRDKVASPESPGFVGIFFESGPYVSIALLGEDQTPAASIRNKDARTRRNIEALIGPDAVNTNRGYYDAVFFADPEELSLGTPFTQAAAVKILLLFKDSLARGAETGFYWFENEYVEGYQVGGPRGLEAVTILAFDSEDRHLSISVTPQSGSPPLTQDELNCIIQSIRPAEEPRE